MIFLPDSDFLLYKILSLNNSQIRICMFTVYINDAHIQTFVYIYCTQTPKNAHTYTSGAPQAENSPPVLQKQVIGHVCRSLWVETSAGVAAGGGRP